MHIRAAFFVYSMTLLIIDAFFVCLTRPRGPSEKAVHAAHVGDSCWHFDAELSECKVVSLGVSKCQGGSLIV